MSISHVRCPGLFIFTSGLAHFTLNKSQTCQAISLLLLVPGQSVTYQFASIFRKESIPVIRSTFGEKTTYKKGKVIFSHFSPVNLGGTCHSPWLTCPLYFKQVPGLRVWQKICSGLNVEKKINWFLIRFTLISRMTQKSRKTAEFRVTAEKFNPCSSFRDKLNFENRTINKGATGIFVKHYFCQKRSYSTKTRNRGEIEEKMTVS